MSVTNRRLIFVVGLALVIALSAAGLTTRATAQGNAGGRLRFVHGLPGSPAVDITIDKVVAVRALGYASASRHLNVPAGEHAVTIAASGSTTPIYQGKVTAGAGQALTVIIQGTTAAVELGIYEDDLGPVAAGNTRFTASQAIKDAPAVDVMRGDGSPLIQGLKYNTPYGAFDIPATAVNIAVVPAGSDANSAVLKADNLPLVAGTHNRLIALGTLQGAVKPSYLLLTAATDADNPAQSTLVRFVHASAGTPAVDVYVGSQLFVPALSMGDSTPHIALPAGSADVSVRAVGSTVQAALAWTTLSLTGGKALTVVLAGPTDGPTLLTAEDNNAQLAPTTARLNIINATGSGTATVKVGDAIAPPGAKGIEIPAGDYDISASVDNPKLQLATSQPFSGGVLYDVIIAGNDKTNKLIVAATGLNEQLSSALAPVAVAQATQPALAPTQPAQPTAVPPTPTLLPTQPAQPTAEPPTAEPPTAEPPSPTPVQDQPTAAPDVVEVPTRVPPTAIPSGTIGTVQTNPGVNLKIKEYPSTEARTLALAPSETALVITGVAGLVPPTGQPTPSGTRAPTPTRSAEGMTMDKLWLFVTWSQADGGEVTGWVRADYVRLTKNGRLVKEIVDVLALRQILPTTPGEINSGSVTPVAADPNQIIGTITVDEGRNLQLRRTPGIDGESLALVPAGATVIVLSKYDVKPKGVIGEPTNPTWLLVRYETDQGAITGWVNLQYVQLTRNQRPLDIADVRKATEITRGFIEGNATAVKPPAAPGIIATVNKVNPGTNLQLRSQPDATSESLALIPSGSELQVVGRNGDGNWLKVKFEDKEGWINSQYVTVTKSGKTYNIADITNITKDKDTTGIATPGPSPTKPA